jgi:D-alanyl-D-alanine carboxypeptidase (penicillin-binding protein 5/6)
MQPVKSKKTKLFVILGLFLLPTLGILGKRIFFPSATEKILSEEDIIRKRYDETLKVSYDSDPSWYPDRELAAGSGPAVVAESAILVDLNSGKLLFNKNSSDKREIASLVKIMTAVIALEHKNLDDKVLIPEDATTIGENSMGLTSGEVFTLEELLYGLIMDSGNDSAYAIARSTAGDIGTFVKWMNIKAEELGLNDTKFFDPSGLDDSSKSTAVDLVKLTRYALKNPKFKEIVATVQKELPASSDHKYLPLYNQTNLLTTYPGVLGVKTGYTEEAGLCLVTYAKNDEKEVVGVVLDSVNRKGDMILMLDHGFSTLGVAIEHNLLK